MKQKVVQFSKLAAALCLVLGLWGGIASAQNRGITVKGTVMDGDGLPVIGAGVTIQGTTTGVAGLSSPVRLLCWRFRPWATSPKR